MNRRALTMIETLLALALLATLVTSALAWVSVAGQVTARLHDATRSQSLAAAIFDLIHDDLVASSCSSQAEKGERAPRVQVQDNVLGIQRSDSIIRQYRRDHTAGRLERIERVNGSVSVRPLAFDNAAFQCMVDEEGRWLDVTITCQASPRSGGTLHAGSSARTRRFNLR